MVDKEETGIQIITAIYLAIEEHGSKGVISGELYARLMGYMDFDTYNGVIGILKRLDKITETNYVLKAKEVA